MNFWRSKAVEPQATERVRIEPKEQEQSLMSQLENEQQDEPRPKWVVKEGALRQMAQEFFEEWMTDRGDGVPEDSVRKMAQRACRAAAIFEEEFRDFKDDFYQLR